MDENEKEMTETKPWYQSTAVVGGLAAFVSAVLGMLKIAVPEADINMLLASVGTIVGSVMAIIGRFKATKKIS